MSFSGGRVQTQNDQHVTNEAATRKHAECIKARTQQRTALPAIVVVVGVLGVIHWWRRRNRGSQADGKPSKFSFPKAGRISAELQQLVQASASASSSLPRNLSSNNKKNKDRKREERKRRADYREKNGGAAASDPKDKEGGTIILTSRHIEMAPGMGASAPKIQRRGVAGQSSDEGKLLENLANKAAGR